MKYICKVSVFLMLFGLVFSSCKDKAGGGGLNFFSLEDDKQFGAQVAAEIENDPATYDILDSAQNVDAYAYLYAILADEIVDFSSFK